MPRAAVGQWNEVRGHACQFGWPNLHVECNLWRNPDAVREVIAQILDYAAELASLSYDQL
jgi:hypothetical protein